MCVFSWLGSLFGLSDVKKEKDELRSRFRPYWNIMDDGVLFCPNCKDTKFRDFKEIPNSECHYCTKCKNIAEWTNDLSFEELNEYDEFIIRRKYERIFMDRRAF